jgi:hypothetical protein
MSIVDQNNHIRLKIGFSINFWGCRDLVLYFRGDPMRAVAHRRMVGWLAGQKHRQH